MQHASLSGYSGRSRIAPFKGERWEKRERERERGAKRDRGEQEAGDQETERTRALLLISPYQTNEGYRGERGRGRDARAREKNGEGAEERGEEKAKEGRRGILDGGNRSTRRPMSGNRVVRAFSMVPY